ncbi:hypothetical protein ABT324_28070 [Saccharopolyspora sp. NPDC000359]|uniref:hypothetical protein n=1 Tax=Saccharopolyspora sp. NPDC000359 TaxID=3154251 RepID=UPI003323843B
MDITTEATPAYIKDGLCQAAQDLREIADDNAAMRAEFESEGWSGLEQLAMAGDKIGAAYDSLLSLGEKFGLAEEVAAAYQANEMVGSKRTVTEVEGA